MKKVLLPTLLVLGCLFILDSYAVYAQDAPSNAGKEILYNGGRIRFVAGVDYKNYNLNFDNKSNNVAFFNFGLHFTPDFPLRFAVDYGFEQPQRNSRAFAIGANIEWRFITFRTSDAFDVSIPFLEMTLGARYQYDNLFVNGFDIYSNSIGPLFRVNINQLRFETGYLWGVNKVDLSPFEKGYMNTFYLRFAVDIPTYSRSIIRAMKNNKEEGVKENIFNFNFN